MIASVETTVIASSAPTVTLTRPTPPKSIVQNPTRLVYRGALSLPDSDLALDGISFTTSSASLLSSPLPLALESQRKRSLPLIGAVDISSLKGRLDHENAVRMFIHPQAKLSMSFFEATLCTTKLRSSDGVTEMGVRIGLGDSHTVNDSDVIIYGRLSDHQSSVIQLYLAQIKPLLRPAQKQINRPPRPDDPTPRLPPLLLPHTKGSPGRRGMKRVRSDSSAMHEKEVARKKAKGRVVLDDIPKLDIKGKSKAIPGTGVFKVPEGPAVRLSDPPLESVERPNKELVRNVTRKSLASRGVTKAHPEFEELQGWIYRGTLFAFRAKIKLKPLAPDEVGIIVERHTSMYAD
ncbi:hypothetical protein SISNIDRAFT_490744 [Sistotremastrum niveocremeum HHB9708]|uniref:Sld7 C-terminal domain-containing protein n=1 Tax=Sistotremastrum niveocremeum HHB9708 TaxID=1314777 RepID=A0A164NJX0_9AGAM|nr:hypothetical protein SISNIDRAFT_490744 [Sistotremastrum niveocremeum HHB9708]